MRATQVVGGDPDHAPSDLLELLPPLDVVTERLPARTVNVPLVLERDLFDCVAEIGRSDEEPIGILHRVADYRLWQPGADEREPHARLHR